MRRLLVTTIFLSSVLFAQEVKAPPKLKDSIVASVRTLQLQIANTNVEILRAQQQQAQWQNQITAELQTALKDSDIDAEKYELDPNTLTVKEKPARGPTVKKEEKK
jgi:ABC-type phosphate transport system auxiliary subunit